MMSDNCKIVQDLLPNYIEKVTSTETNEFVENHLKQCKNCTQIFKDMTDTIKTNDVINDKEVDYMKKVNEKIKKLQVYKKILILIGIIIILVYMLTVIYKYNVLCKIKKESDTFKDFTNLHFYSETLDGIREGWEKDGVIKQNIKPKKGEEYLIQWGNRDSEQCILVWNKTKIYMETLAMYSGLTSSETSSMNNKERFLFALNPTTFIKEKKYDDKDCYYLKFYDRGEFIEKDTGICLYMFYESERNSRRI